MVSKRRKKIKSRWINVKKIFFLIFFAVLIFFLIYSNINLLKERSSYQETLDELDAKQEDLLKQRETLKFKVGETYSEAYLEKVAREDLDMQKPGEQVYVIKKDGEEGGENESENKEGFFQKLKTLFNIE